MSSLVVDPALLRKYGGNGPRYTWYATADRFVEALGADAHRRWLQSRDIGALRRPLGLYVHVPFCDTPCFYCACNKIAARDRDGGTRYVDHLLEEAAITSRALRADAQRISPSSHFDPVVRRAVNRRADHGRGRLGPRARHAPDRTR
jgi:hypothetical protein